MREIVDPLVRPDDLLRISPHVHVIPDGSRRGVPNVGIVVGERRALVVDTGMGTRNGAAVLGVVRSVAPDRPLMLVTTHVHPEHDLGAGAFPAETVLLRARTQVDEIAESGSAVADDFRATSPFYRDLLEGAAFRPADIVFDDSLVVDLGGVRAIVTAMGTNHTPGDTVVHVPDEGVLFSGDIAMSGAPAFASPRSRITPWLRSLDRLRRTDATILVPSHGPLGDTALIDGYERHLRRILDQTRELVADGSDREAIVDAVVAERLDDFGDEDLLRGAIRAALREHDEGGNA